MTTNKTLSRRLQRLEEELVPLEERIVRVWQVVLVDSDGCCRDGERIEWSPPRPVSTRRPTVPAFRKRYR
jgi:hypothetical protein